MPMYTVAGVAEAARKACFELILDFMDSRMVHCVLDTLFLYELPCECLDEKLTHFPPHRRRRIVAPLRYAAGLTLAVVGKSGQ